MKSDPYLLPENISEDEYRICQACGDPIKLKTDVSGVPTLSGGHRIGYCEHLENFVHLFQTNQFGIVVPQKEARVIWEFQTNGLMCSHPDIKGTYIPLNTITIPEESVNYDKLPFKKTDDYWADPLRLLARTNYKNNTSDDYYNTEYIWDLINEKLPFSYKEVDPPRGYRGTHEAWKWINITGVKDEKGFIYNNLEPLVGERVLLVYPNSD